MFMQSTWTPLDHLLSDALCLAVWSQELAQGYPLLLEQLLGDDKRAAVAASVAMTMRDSRLPARASIAASVLVPEALANCVLRKEDFPEAVRLYDEIDRLPTLPKLMLAVRLRTGARLDLGAQPVVEAKALQSLRDQAVHPRPVERDVNAHVFTQPRTEHPVLGVAMEPEHRTFQDAKRVLQVALTFVDHMLLDVCSLSVTDARLLSMPRISDTQGPTIVVPTHLMGTAPIALPFLGLTSRLLAGLPVVNDVPASHPRAK